MLPPRIPARSTPMIYQCVFHTWSCTVLSRLDTTADWQRSQCSSIRLGVTWSRTSSCWIHVEYYLATKHWRLGHVLRNEVLLRDITEGRMEHKAYHRRKKIHAHWVQAGHADVETSAQSTTKLPLASCSCCRCAWSSTTPLRQHWLPGGAACQAVICRQPSFPGCCTSQSYNLLSHCIPATSENIFVSTIFSGRHRDTLVDLAIVFFLLRPL